MKKYRLLAVALIILSFYTYGQNPVIRDQFSADPTARVFNGKVYLFPSHDIPTPPQKPGRKDWFCMEDYHVFSSIDLNDWTDHGVILSQEKVNWVDATSYSMWAPDCVERNGKYYFYFSANNNITDANGRKGFSIGVAVAERPEGPYIPQPEPIKNVLGIDPNVFIDKDGQAYLYWSMQHIYVAKLKENMLELASEPQVIANLPEKGLKEGPYVFERNGIYYLTFPHVENKIERLEYAIGYSPMGPFSMKGVIMDESPVNCWTNHHSLIQYNNQWYLFYHHNDYSPKFDKNRSVRIDSLFFNADGSIQKVIPTLRGVGLTKAYTEIQMDRYSRIAEKGAVIAFNDSLNTFKGWKTVFTAPCAWVKYNSVDFEKGKFKSVEVKAFSSKGGILQIHLDQADGPVIAEIAIPANNSWETFHAKVSKISKGVHHLIAVLKDGQSVEVDWIKFIH